MCVIPDANIMLLSFLPSFILQSPFSGLTNHTKGNSHCKPSEYFWYFLNKKWFKEKSKVGITGQLMFLYCWRKKYVVLS